MKPLLFNDNWNVRNSAGTSFEMIGGMGAAEEVTLPHDAVIKTKRVPQETDDTSRGGTGFYASKNLMYTKRFTLPKAEGDQVVWFAFDGIYHNAYIYINHAFAGRCPYGYGNYFIDATRYVKFGEENEIKVIVKNGTFSGRWYTGGGIYRDVNMYIGNALHIGCRGVKIATLEAEENQGLVRVEIPVENKHFSTQHIQLKTELIGSDGEIAAVDTSTITVFGSDSNTVRQRILVKQPHLWSVDDPYLYTVNVTLLDGDVVVDQWSGETGIRKITLDSGKGLRINGKSIKLLGGCIHHDLGVIGAASFEHMELRRIQKMKEAGFNAIRCAHNPAGTHLLNACDRVGMLVMDEFTDVWTSCKGDTDYAMQYPTFMEDDIRNWIDRDYNHPSVIFYSIGNEIPETGNAIDVQWGKKAVDLIHTLDDTRYVTNGINYMLSVMDHMQEIMQDIGSKQSVAGEINTVMSNRVNLKPMLNCHKITTELLEEACDQLDLVGLNYNTERYKMDAEGYPNRIIFGSETLSTDIVENWEYVRKYPNIIGDFVWAGWDYLGEAGIGRWYYGEPKGNNTATYGEWPWRIAYNGVIDIIGNPRPVHYWRQCVLGLRRKPYISVCPPEHFGEQVNMSMWGFTDGHACWNWEGFEGKPIRVEVYSNADEVELFVNKKSIGRKQVGLGEKACVTVFETVYTPGEVKAVSYKNGEKEEYSLITALDDNVLHAECDRTILQVGGQDVACIEISLTDDNGVLNAASEKSVHVEVEGEGELLGLGSGNPLSEEDYFAKDICAYQGRLLAVIRSGNKMGTITVKISADGCEDKQIIILASE